MIRKISGFCLNSISLRLKFSSSPITSIHIPHSKFSTINIVKNQHQLNSDEGWKYFQPTKKGDIKLIQDKVTCQNDLKHAYEEYVSLIKQIEEKGKLKCKSCGISGLQSKDDNSDRYYKIPKVSLQLQSKKNSQSVNSRRGEYALMEELGIDTEDETSKLFDRGDILIEQRVKELSEAANYKVECLRCKNLRNHGLFDINQSKVENILEKIPANATIVNVISFFDFPLSCNKELIKGRNPKDIYYVVTKADLFFRQEVQLNRTGLIYVQDFLQKYLDADRNKVFLVSTNKSWNNNDLLQKLPNGKVYLVGRANAGKSSLIRSLIAYNHGIDIQDKVVKNIEKKNMNYLEKVGLDSPGTNHIPGFTREFQKFKITDKLTIFDTPGIFPEDHGIYRYLSPDILRKKPKYPGFVPEDLRRFTKTSIKGPKIYNGKSLFSYAGYFYLQPPAGAIFKRCIGIKSGEKKFEVRYPSMKRAAELNEERPKQLGNRYAVKPEAYVKLRRYVIPPFYGTFDIVIQDIGFISIQPTNSPTATNGLYQIWVPEGVRVIVRESIFNFIYKTHGLVDETGNKLKKEKIASRGVTRLRRLSDEDKLHFTELVPVDIDSTSEEAFAQVCPPEDMNVAGSATSQETYKNQYWRKLKL
ncbi:Mitochondrial ribosome small subunit biogenesis protein [Pichia californica]|uniref:Genetic interactor of prohibitins 3, mitochondrial n=1 Tax=Pichia californica TaxID=460514 RepID=A0A9P6WI71_9ASCO|nr:Mitochondrial ribosome small subunit biogenesis protein [[Candida] californica]KAG0687615.1 Mitochondrial ribosome small subunit biogenesis protein [[Candida] californica]